MGLEAGGRGGAGEKKKKKEKEEEEEKIPHMCESIGHRSLRGRCPKVEKQAFWILFGQRPQRADVL